MGKNNRTNRKEKVQKELKRKKGTSHSEGKKAFVGLITRLEAQDRQLLAGLNNVESRAMTTWNTLNVVIRMMEKKLNMTREDFQTLFNETAAEVLAETKERVDKHIAAMKEHEQKVKDGQIDAVPTAPLDEAGIAGKKIDELVTEQVKKDEEQKVIEAAESIPE